MDSSTHSESSGPFFSDSFIQLHPSLPHCSTNTQAYIMYRSCCFSFTSFHSVHAFYYLIFLYTILLWLSPDEPVDIDHYDPLWHWSSHQNFHIMLFNKLEKMYNKPPDLVHSSNCNFSC